MSARKKIVLIAITLIIVGVIAIVIYRKNRYSKAYNDMLALGRQYINGGFPQWLIDAAERGDVNLDAGHLINGKATPIGNLLAAYTQKYFGYGYEYKDGKPARNTGNEKALNDALWARFYQEKNK